jgi:DNA-binding NarL/FixJ family response regulator
MNALEHGLILEDHPDARIWLSEAVLAAFPGIELATCTTLKDSLKNVEARSPHLALVDLQLPDGSGLDLIERLNAGHPDCIVVVATVYEDDSHLFSALRAGAHGYVLKDEPQDSVAHMLRGIVAGQPALSPKIARRLLNHFRPEPESAAVRLTEREEDVLSLLAKGFTVKKVAELLEISPNTAAGYVKTIYRKLNISSRAEATLEATQRGLVGRSM